MEGINNIIGGSLLCGIVDAVSMGRFNTIKQDLTKKSTEVFST